jgi:hypothetical protein
VCRSHAPSSYHFDRDSRVSLANGSDRFQEVVLGGTRVVPPADQHPHFDVVLDGRRLQGVVDRRPEPHPRGVDRQREVVHHGYVDEFLGVPDHVDEGVYVVGAAGGVERRRRTLQNVNSQKPVTTTRERHGLIIWTGLVGRLLDTRTELNCHVTRENV